MKVYLKTFGCRANQYDSETVRAMIERAGGSVVPVPDEADVAIFNSCAVTAEAEVDLRKQVRRAARRRPELRTLVMGCAASLDRGAIASLPTVQHVLPGADFPAVAAALALPPASLGAAHGQSGARALLRIQDGCDEHCTFCATTVARGDNRSRAAATLIDEARALAERHAEIVLTGIHIGTYGHDAGTSLGALVHALVSHVPDVRFRLSSIEASEIDAQLLAVCENAERVAPHLHAPLQSGSDRVLKRMGRHWYTCTTYAAAIERVVRGRRPFGLGADIIAGFPGETDADHRATLDLVDALPFTYLHVFPFSMRPGTPAERLGGHLPADVVQERARELRLAGAAKQAAYARSRDNESADVIVVRGDTREGLTGDYLSVFVEGTAPRGTRLRATLGTSETRLIARPLATAPR